MGPTIPLPITQNPWDRVHVDIAGEYTTCENSGNKYILGFVDSFTKYVELVPISDMKATTVADAFISNVICRHGVPSSLHSDKGQNFLSNIIREVCKILEIKKTNTSGFRPQCNSQIEVVWKSVSAALAKYCHDIPNQWDKYLSLIQFILNTTNCIDSTQFSPFFLEHGRYPKTFIDLAVPSLNENLPKSASEYCAELLQNLEHAKQFAEQNIAQQKQVLSQKSLRKCKMLIFK